ncbi:hypothetical protein H5410_027098 [Solanum commersonii]|uniref:Uncharacterized protein n=1 Tax=Solanum commersonii TaxID=4109 RepID=A0A9J5Z3F2_SOLCO|nr:hypothetical protein H5410_027098 [Solanum commersonii]
MQKQGSSLREKKSVVVSIVLSEALESCNRRVVILGWAYYLDFFNSYPLRTWLPSIYRGHDNWYTRGAYFPIGSIYDLSFMDVDNIHPFRSTLGWHSPKIEGQGSNGERLMVDTEAPKTRKSIVIDEMFWGVENKHRSGDSRIGKSFELLLYI